ncbi:NAD(P)/FAD-dependent oxidoreductase [Oceanobacillus sp. FSL H7-0719]|uniref:NAD(P)/FAD-dependent oxidoreductase n=1 Tax=Oceanobacillus sp. FSL H7-0719 TaxID=2954507 RepID=UPI003255D1AB
MRKKVVIIGGGIVGASAAYALSKQAVEVILIDRADAGQATDAAAGIICPWLSQRRNKAWYRLVKAGAAMYQGLIESLEADGETDIGYKRVGALSIHTDQDKLIAMRDRALKRREDAPEIGDIHLLNEVETKKKFPLIADGYQSVFVTGAARVDGRKLRNAMLSAAEKHGAKIIHGDAQLHIKDSQVTGVKVNNSAISADQVIAAAGAWIDDLIKPLERKLDVRPQKAQILHLKYDAINTSNLPVVMPPNDQYLLSFDDQRFVIGATHEDEAGYDTSVTAFGIQDILNKALRIAPKLNDGAIIEARVGFRPMTPGFLPIIGSFPDYDGLLFANGLGATGLTAGPYLGQELAKLALGQSTELNLEDYQL